MYASAVAEWRYGVRCAPCGVWAVRACGARERERRAAERAEAGDSGAERRGQQRETASPMVLHCVVGEEVAATFGDTEDLFPDGSLFMSLRAIGGASFRFRKERLPPRMATLHPPRCLPSICPSKKRKFCGAKTQT